MIDVRDGDFQRQRQAQRRQRVGIPSAHARLVRRLGHMDISHLIEAHVHGPRLIVVQHVARIGHGGMAKVDDLFNGAKRRQKARPATAEDGDRRDR